MAEREKVAGEHDPLLLQVYAEKARMLDAWATELELTAQAVERIAARTRKMQADLKMHARPPPPSDEG